MSDEFTGFFTTTEKKEFKEAFGEEFGWGRGEKGREVKINEKKKKNSWTEPRFLALDGPRQPSMTRMAMARSTRRHAAEQCEHVAAH